eukprot:5059765-Amphidinium_carterae.1
MFALLLTFALPNNKDNKVKVSKGVSMALELLRLLCAEFLPSEWVSSATPSDPLRVRNGLFALDAWAES